MHEPDEFAALRVYEESTLEQVDRLVSRTMLQSAFTAEEFLSVISLHRGTKA